MTRQRSAEVRGWPCRHLDTLEGPVHLYAYTDPRGECVYTFQRPGGAESLYTYPSVDRVTSAATFWRGRS